MLVEEIKKYPKRIMSKNHYPLIRTIYLYLFTLISLVLLIIGGILFIEMGLKAFVFTEVERQERLMHQWPFHSPDLLMPIVENRKNQQEIEEKKEICLTEAEKEIFDGWLVDYKEWEEERMGIDPVAVQRHREASSSLAMILIGLPLYLYHWAIIKKETRNKKEEGDQNKKQ